MSPRPTSWHGPGSSCKRSPPEGVHTWGNLNRIILRQWPSWNATMGHLHKQYLEHCSACSAKCPDRSWRLLPRMSTKDGGTSLLVLIPKHFHQMLVEIRRPWISSVIESPGSHLPALFLPQPPWPHRSKPVQLKSEPPLQLVKWSRDNCKTSHWEQIVFFSFQGWPYGQKIQHHPQTPAGALLRAALRSNPMNHQVCIKRNFGHISY